MMTILRMSLTRIWFRLTSDLFLDPDPLIQHPEPESLVQSGQWSCLVCGLFLMFVLDDFTRLLIGLEQHTRIAVTWTSTPARSELAEPSMPTTTRRTRAPSSWWTRRGQWEACTAEAGSLGVVDSSVPAEVQAGGILTWTWRTPDRFKYWARHRRTKKGSLSLLSSFL